MRRSLLLVLLGFILSTFASTAVAQGQVTFTHGVASGDVTSSKAVLWTRVNEAATIKVEVWDNAALQGKKAFKRVVNTSAASDFTAKADASGLLANTTYYYQWKTETDVRSPVGKFKTAPSPSSNANVKFTYSGDSDGTLVNGAPFFNNFETLDRAREENGDFFFYLGDTIYGDSGLRPSGPATTVDDYRDAYKVNRGYAALRNLQESTSTYAQWDDHEVVNDYDGQNVNPARYAAGRQAFLEYMPIRESDLPSDPSCAGNPIYKNYRWGSDAEIILIDTRSCRSPDVAVNPCLGDLGPTVPAAVRQGFGLPASPPPGCLAAINDPGRTLLGPVQKQLLKNALASSDAKFKFIVNPEPIQQFYALPYDRWEGYAAERTELLHFIRDNSIQNVVFLTTDTHATLLNQVFVDNFASPTARGYEIVTGPIATNTFQTEVLAFGGTFALQGVNFLMGMVGMDCRHLDADSYASVDVNATADTATVTSKDETGFPIIDQAGGELECTKTLP
jgi:alkaline phosphatase D